jgi:hypothetical protein
VDEDLAEEVLAQRDDGGAGRRSHAAMTHLGRDRSGKVKSRIRWAIMGKVSKRTSRAFAF